MDLLSQLNDKQKEAVTTTKGAVRVIAGPGTGKTKTLVTRNAYLIEHENVPPESILSMTFTNKAAWEMRDRIDRLLILGIRANVHTFHGFCYQFLRAHIHRFDYPNYFSILDREDQERTLKDIYTEMNLSAREYPCAEMIKTIADLKDQVKYVHHLTSRLRGEELTISGDIDIDDIQYSVFEHYLRRQRNSRALDFNDLLFFTLELFNENEDLLSMAWDQYRYIQVDEFQDINKPQYDLVHLLQRKHGNLFVVGDPDQTIYSFRGADIDFINLFDKSFPESKTIVLTENYRSHSSILNVCDALIKKNTNRIEKKLKANSTGQGQVFQCQCQNIYDEANFVAEMIHDLTRSQSANFEDIAILYRSGQLSRRIEESLMKRQIPYTIVRGLEFYNRAEIKDALAFLKLLVFGDDISFLRIINKPARQMGVLRVNFVKAYARENESTLLEALYAYRDEHIFKHEKTQEFIDVIKDMRGKVCRLSPSQALEEVLLRTGYEESLLYDPNVDRIENIRELKRSLARSEKQNGDFTIHEYLNELALFSETMEASEPNRVKLMTIHSAKGLEFPHVIVCGLNQGIFPSSKIASYAEYEEERRLAYVAFSRAKSTLTLTNAGGFDYNRAPLKPSPFLEEIGTELLRKIKRQKFFPISNGRPYGGKR